MSVVVRWPRVLTPTQLSQIIKTQKNPLTVLRLFRESKLKYPNYRHNGPVYATMIHILGASGRIREMRDVIEEMRVDSCECKDSVFTSAINTYARVGLLDEAVELFRSIPRFNCVNWTESFNAILGLMVQAGRVSLAHRLFLESSCGWGVKSRLRSLNFLMGALCRQGRSDLALNVFQEMEFQGCYPDRDSYRILMKGLCDDGRLNEATHLLYSMFWRISRKGSGADVVIYRTLLDALCDNGQVEEAVVILGKILRKGLKAPNSCLRPIDLSQCKNGEDIEATKRLINEALIRGGVPSLASYTAMSVDLYNEGKVSEADKVLDETQSRGFKPSILTYEAKMEALCREGKVHEAVNVIEVEMVKANFIPTVKLYNILLKCLCDTGNSTMGLRYLNKMAKQLGCVANQETYSILEHGLCKERKFIEASKILEEMLIRSYQPSTSDAYNQLIPGLCSIGRCYDAIMWLEEMISRGHIPRLSVWTSLVSSLCSNMDDIDVCRETFQQLCLSS